MSRTKRFLSMLLCMVLCFSLLPSFALSAAADAGFDESNILTQDPAEAPNAEGGDVKNDVSPETQYLNQCASFTSYADLVMTSGGYMKTLPCNKDTNGASDDVVWLGVGETLVATELWKNTKGDYWYKASYNGKTGYVYSGSVNSTAKWNVTITGVTAPTGNLNLGWAFIIKGEVKSGSLRMTKIGAKVYYDTDAGLSNPLTGTEVTVNTNSYSLEGSTLDTYCKFGSLARGAYNYVVYCTAENHIAKGDSMSTVTKTFKDLSKKELYVSHFTVAYGTSATTYTVTFNANGGKNAPKAQSKLKGVDLTLTKDVPTAPSGYHFLGWATKKTATKPDYKAGAKYTKDADITLYAVWQSNTPMIRSNPDNVSVVEGDTAIFTVSAEGTGLKYQWQYQKPGETKWTSVQNNGTSSTYSLKTLARHNGYTYRCKVTEGDHYACSETATLTVISKPTIITQPVAVKVNEDKTASFSVIASGENEYQWYYRKTSSGAWTAVKENGTSATYSLVTKARHNGYQYRCKVYNAAGTVYSSIVTLEVVAKPTISTQPTAVSVTKGKTATFKVTAAGPNLKYQWYYLAPGATTWTKVSKNGTSATYELKTEARHNGFKYKCVITNEAGSVTSKEVKLTVK